MQRNSRKIEDRYYSVFYFLRQYTVWDDPGVHQYVCSPCLFYCSDWYGFWQLRVSVRRDNYVLIEGFRL